MVAESIEHALMYKDDSVVLHFGLGGLEKDEDGV